MVYRSLAENETSLRENEKITSQRRIEANHRNAQRSTGPTSAEGKRNSSRNALKHGLLTRDVVITNGALRENQGEFDALLAALHDSYRPSDIVEDLLVEEIAVSYWRSARALRCERGDVTWNKSMPDEPELAAWELWTLNRRSGTEAHRWLLESSSGIKFLFGIVEQAKEDVKNNGFVSTKLHRWLNPSKHWSSAAFSSKDLLLAALDKETERLKAIKFLIQMDEPQNRNGRRDRWAIPSKEVLDSINRYETSNVRHRYKVEARLERLQARRRENAEANFRRDSHAESAQTEECYETKANCLRGRRMA
ncbi:MAG: hypothetical protein ABSF15_13800 [Candidatus Sulfotelmatobacter sp.]|jgi:hypothetical protein